MFKGLRIAARINRRLRNRLKGAKRVSKKLKQGWDEAEERLEALRAINEDLIIDRHHHRLQLESAYTELHKAKEERAEPTECGPQ